jgi:hypothetical protein
VNNAEAQEHVDKGGIVTAGGYTYFNGGYFAFGTYPGCQRGGEVDLKTYYRDDLDWKALTEKDIVSQRGYKPDYYVKPILNDGTVDFRSLTTYVEKRVLVCDWSNPQINSKICREYFNND